MQFAGFDWDDGNLKKCSKHGVSQKEIESLFAGAVAVEPDKKHSQEEPRFIAIGRTKRRYVFVVFTLRKRNVETLLRPISARYMHAKEIEAYEKKTPHP